MSRLELSFIQITVASSVDGDGRLYNSLYGLTSDGKVYKYDDYRNAGWVLMPMHELQEDQ